MGWERQDINIYLMSRNGDLGKIAYNERSDLLMEVIEKIESLPTNLEDGDQFQFSITGDGIIISQYDDGSGIIAQEVNEIGKNKTKSIFKVVSKFCKWYQENEKEHLQSPLDKVEKWKVI